jgi:CheY-like chemotaxis protein
VRLAKTPAILRTNGTRIAVAERGGLALKPRILIYDKDQAITRQLFWTLCDTYDVVTANDLPTALRRAAAYEPAVAVLDLSVPAIPGYEAVGVRILQYLKVHFPKSRILGMTIEILPETKRNYFSLGVDELLDKPFDTQQLLDLLRRLAPLHSFDAVESGSFTLYY